MQDRSALDLSALTPRQREVLAVFGNRKRRKVLAKELGVSVNAVSNSRKEIYRRLDVHSRSELLTKLFGTWR